jgi:hypothetical protein
VSELKQRLHDAEAWLIAHVTCIASLEAAATQDHLLLPQNEEEPPYCLEYLVNCALT